MSSVNSAYSSSSRITGLFSNLDTDALVESMCSGQQSKIDKQEQKKTTCQWYNEAMQSISDAVKDFSNTYCSALGTSSMLKASTYSVYSITSSSTGSAVSLSADNSAWEGNISVKVSQLAENASAASSGKVSKDGTEISSSNTKALSELSFANALQFGSDNKISFSINGKDFSFTSDTTLQSMLNTINNDSDAGVTMKYSRLTDTFTITADSGGEDSQVSIVNKSGNAFGKKSAFMIDTGTSTNGKNAVLEINGTSVERDSNEFTIDGISYALNKVTEGTDEETIDFTVKRDFSATTDAVSKFVDAFNTLITTLSDYISAKDYSDDYKPLTEAQEGEMTDDQIETWNEKAKSGILRYDSKLESLISDLKAAFFSAAGGTGKASTSIGISSGSFYSTDKGLLVLDSDALTKALETNPDEVVAMFTGGSSSVSSAEQGIAYKVKNSMTAYLSAANDSISNTDDKIDNIDDEIEELEDRLDAMAEKYYNKFSTMETALAKLNSQSSYISQLFA